MADELAVSGDDSNVVIGDQEQDTDPDMAPPDAYVDEANAALVEPTRRRAPASASRMRMPTPAALSRRERAR